MSGKTKHVCMLEKRPDFYELPPTISYGSRCRQFRELFLPCEWHHGTRQYIRSEKCLRLERSRMKGAVAHPYSAAVFYWGCFHALITGLVLIYIPFQVFMYCPNKYDPLILFTDFLSLINICGSFLTGYAMRSTKTVELSHRRIARNYIKTRLFPDIIGGLPLQLITIYEDCEYPTHTVMYIFKLFRLFTLNYQFDVLLEQLGLSYVKKQVIVISTDVFLFFHWVTYIHYQVPALFIHFFKSDEVYRKWIQRIFVVEINEQSITEKYIANLFLVCGLCIGAGHYLPIDNHIIPELLLTSCLGLIGLVFITYSFSALLRLAMYKRHERYIFNGRCKELKNFMQFKRLPKFLQHKIHLFINYKFNGHYFNEESIMNTINEQIKQDINMHCCKKLVTNVSLFQDIPVALINAIIFNLTQVLYMPGEVLVSWGTTGSYMCLISSGTVAVISSTGREIGHLRDGSYFGETALLYPGSPRTATIIALEITEVYKLESKDFQTCLHPYPHLKRRLEESYLRRRKTALLNKAQLKYSPRFNR